MGIGRNNTLHLYLLNMWLRECEMRFYMGMVLFIIAKQYWDVKFCIFKINYLEKIYNAFALKILKTF